MSECVRACVRACINIIYVNICAIVPCVADYTEDICEHINQIGKRFSSSEKTV